MREVRCDVLVVGAGPAGLAAAAAAAEGGQSVIVLDENPHLGGQIWRPQAAEANQPSRSVSPRAAAAPPSAHAHRRAHAWHQRAQKRGVIFETGMTLFDAPRTDHLLAVDAAGQASAFSAQQVILATGAAERFLPFPGWTLPGVMGVGGLQAMVKGGMAVRGKRILLAGTGPLLLAVAAFLLDHGAHVVGIAEQASRAAVRRFGTSLWRHPNKLVQAARLFTRLRAVPLLHDAWPTQAEGFGRVEQVRVAAGDRCQEFDVDLLACAFGLVPRTELARLMGCATQSHIDGEIVAVDRWQRTTVATVWCAGEPTGIGGVDLAVAEGLVAGYAASGAFKRAGRAARRRDRARAFAERLDRAYALRPALRALPTDATVVCRCEDVTWQAIRAQPTIRQAKLQTRCGMGPCQGRICGPALAFLTRATPAAPGTATQTTTRPTAATTSSHAAGPSTGWTGDRVRPPLVPVAVNVLIGAGQAPLANHQPSPAPSRHQEISL